MAQYLGSYYSKNVILHVLLIHVPCDPTLNTSPPLGVGGGGGDLLIMFVSLCNLAARMAPNLGSSKKEAADMMITVGDLTAVQMANVVDCHERTIRRLRTNKRLFGSVKAPRGT